MRIKALGKALFASAITVAASCSGAGDALAPDQSTQVAARLPQHATPVQAAVAMGTTPVAIDRELGVPRLLRGGPAVMAAPAATAFASAQVHLARLAPAWGVRAETMPELVGLGDVEVDGGARIARIEQKLDGLPIDGGELRVLVGKQSSLLAVSGVLRGTDALRNAPVFTADDAQAVARAVAHTHQSTVAANAFATKWTKQDGSRVIGGAAGDVVVELAHAKRVWWPSGGVLTAAWAVEAYTSKATSTDSELWRTIVSADGRRVLEHRSLQSDVAFKYRVFADAQLQPADGPIQDFTPHPAGTPNGAFPAYMPSVLVEIDGLNTNSNGGTDPWLPSTRTETWGNNVEAYADFNAPSGLTAGDFRATTTGTRAFDRAFDPLKAPLDSQAQQMAAITNLFFAINWLHDFWYDAGFTEAAGNAQDNNYGRGGQDRDAILAEAQDNALGGSRNNANMNTPRDGLPPRMQVFVWTGRERARALTVGTRTPSPGVATWGPKRFDITSGLVLANDTGGVTTTDACEALAVAAVQGKVVLADRGNCTFKRKALNIQQAGGVGMILVDNAANATPPGMGEDAAITTPITIGTMSVTMADGAQLKSDLQAGAVTAHLVRDFDEDYDGSVDATLVAHEFGHYLHHRLSLCGDSICGAISEGWGDFTALMLMAREGDDLDGAFPFSIYTTQSFTDDPGYYGIRRAPYSVNKNINALSFRHMQHEEPLPTNHPFLPFGINSEVHNAGEIWAAAMWEVYVALQKAGTSFDETRKKMAKYVVAGMLLAPVEASPTEVRDAILTAIHAVSPADHDIAAAAFARRGFGSCAVSPNQVEVGNNTVFVDLVESDKVAGRAVVGAQLTEAVEACDDDADLDAGETLKITIPVANTGHAPLTNVTATLTSATPGLTVVTPPAAIANIPAYGTANLVAEVTLDGDLDAPAAGDFMLNVATADGCTMSTDKPFSIRLAVDDVPESSATDSFDAATSVWTATASDVPVWTHQREGALDGFWHGADLGATTDVSVVSPAVTVGDGPFTVTLSHRYEFEYDASGAQPIAFDGGVIEVSTDGGATWQDVSALGANPGYTATLDPGNALGARMALADKIASHPAPDTLTLDFGTSLAGKQVQLRFRIGTDGGVGAPGWEIDDVAMSGIVGTPFPAQVADDGACGTDGPDPDGDDDGGGCCDARALGAGNLGAALGVLALVLRRRRRR